MQSFQSCLQRQSLLSVGLGALLHSIDLLIAGSWCLLTMHYSLVPQLQKLVHLLPLMKLAILRQGLQRVQSLQGQPEKEQQQVLPALDKQVSTAAGTLERRNQ